MTGVAAVGGDGALLVILGHVPLLLSILSASAQRFPAAAIVKEKIAAANAG